MVDKIKPAVGTGDLIRGKGKELHELANKEQEEFNKIAVQPYASEAINAAYEKAEREYQGGTP